MLTAHRLRPGGFLLVLFVLACSGSELVEPVDNLTPVAASGSSLKAPSSTGAVALSENRIDISWQDNSTNETGFEVQRSAGGVSGTFSYLIMLAAGTTSHNDTGLTPSAQYCYKVRAFRITGNKTTFSAFSATACATTLAPTPPPLPSAPSSINAIPSRSTEIAVFWSANWTDQADFRVERSTDGGADWSSAGTTSANDSRVLWDAGRTPEQQVCYRVFAFNITGDSPPTDSDCTTPPLGPTNLTAIVVDPLTLEVSLTWIDNSAVEDGYQVGVCYPDGSCTWQADVPANSTSYQFISFGDPYQESYTVAAMKDGGSSDWSDLASPVSPEVSSAERP
jgi:hypothetical protein